MRSLSTFLRHGAKPGAAGDIITSIDVHTHMYLPGYMNILKKRTDIPRVSTINGQDRLIILPGEDNEKTTNIGRPIGREYWDVNAKLHYMNQHHIEKSVVSLANPWLDFLTGNEAESVAQELNDELQQMCESSQGRLYGFATLPVRNAKASVKEIERISKLSHIRGVILGTPGAGKGLDHEEMREVLAAIEAKGLMIFLHPHYGVGNEHYHDSGHALFLALGFPFETTVSVSRLIVSGTFDRFPKLRLLVAHAGAALPALIGRLDSCVAHDIAIASRLHETPTTYLSRLYFDAISYSSPAINSLIEQVGEDRIMFGTDNPFFPPPATGDQPSVDERGISSELWPSTMKVYETMSTMTLERQLKVANGNAKKILNL
jgi:aminocarboxymuconate-semialdehyde decarboxylase